MIYASSSRVCSIELSAATTGRSDLAPLTASLFGRFRLRTNDGREIVVSNRRARALLTMVCVCGEDPIDREYLSGILWTGRFASQAKASLRQCLFELGRQLADYGGDFLEVTRTTVALNKGSVVTDIDLLHRHLAANDVSAATKHLQALGGRPLIDQINLSEDFDLWCTRRRSELEAKLASAVEGTALELAAGGNIHGRDELVSAWALHRASVAGSNAPVSSLAPRRIAILPFRLVGPDGSHAYFADGLVDELRAVLSRIPQLLVAGRTSSFHFRDSALPMPAIANALQVTHLVEGTVQRQGEAIRIFVRLIDGKSSFESWSDRYDGTLDDVFKLQDTVARAVTDALSARLDLALGQPIVRPLTESKAAYDLFLQGRALGARIFGDGVLDNAIGLLERALAIDPDIAEAWIALGEAFYNVAFSSQGIDRAAPLKRAADCANKAIALAPDLGYAYFLLGTYEFTRNNVVGALDLATEAYRRQPDNPDVAMRLAQFLLYCGRTRDAAPHILAAVDQDPVDGRKYVMLSALRFAEGDFLAAQAAGQTAVDLGWPSTWLALATAALGQNALAVEQFQLTKKLLNTMLLSSAGSGSGSEAESDAHWLTAAKGSCSGEESDRRAYHQLLEHFYATFPDNADNAICFPAIFSGHAELVFKSLGQRFTAANIIGLMTLWTDIDPIRQIWQHPKFPDFARRTGLIGAWEKYGWPDLFKDRKFTI